MSISIKKAQEVALYAPKGCVPFFMGPPGFGKSKGITYAAAKRAGAVYMDVYTAVREAVDAAGLPYVLEGPDGRKLTGWAPPGTFPTIASEFTREGEIRVNLDDFPQATPAVQKAYIRAAYGDGASRSLGDVPVLENVMFCGTGNRETDRAGASKPFTYVGNRVCFIEAEPDVDEWAAGYLNGFPVPTVDEDYAAQRKQVDKAASRPYDLLASWVKWSKQVHNFSPEARSFKSPRSLEALGMWMQAADALQWSDEVRMEVASGTLGEAEATQFMAFHRLQAHLPDIEGLLKGEEVPLPRQSDVLFIVCTNIARAGRKEHIPAIAKLLHRLTDLQDEKGLFQGAEIAAYLCNECLHGIGKKELHGLNANRDGILFFQKVGRKYFMD